MYTRQCNTQGARAHHAAVLRRLARLFARARARAPGHAAVLRRRWIAAATHNFIIPSIHIYDAFHIIPYRLYHAISCCTAYCLLGAVAALHRLARVYITLHWIKSIILHYIIHHYIISYIHHGIQYVYGMHERSIHYTTSHCKMPYSTELYLAYKIVYCLPRHVAVLSTDWHEYSIILHVLYCMYYIILYIL